MQLIYNFEWIMFFYFLVINSIPSLFEIFIHSNFLHLLKLHKTHNYTNYYLYQTGPSWSQIPEDMFVACMYVHILLGNWRWNEAWLEYISRNNWDPAFRETPKLKFAIAPPCLFPQLISVWMTLINNIQAN